MPKQNPLVCQHLENVSRDALEQYEGILRRSARRRHNVCALCGLTQDEIKIVEDWAK
jgi:hypothetical protein